MKRFQESNILVKIFRYRWYLIVPFKWLWYNYVSDFNIYDDDDGKPVAIKGNMLWHLLIGDAQSKMNWTYTSEEILDIIKKKR